MREPKGSTRRGRGPAKIATIYVDLSALGEPLLITGVQQVGGRTDRLSIAVNGVTIGDVTLDFVAERPVREGRRVSRADAEGIVDAVARTVVLDKALDLLAVRARSSRDLRVRLRRAGAVEADITWALERLTTQGYVDDASYARQVARAKVVAGGVSRRRVVTTLRLRGVAADVAEAAIAATLEDVQLDEEGAALQAARKRVRALASLDPARRRQRLYAFLARRGYESDVVRRVLAQVLDS